MKVYPPLLDPGFHDGDLDRLKELCVDPFDQHTERDRIHGRFSEFCNRLQEFEVSFEVWVDGSYLTEKPKPNDVDVVVFAEKKVLDRLSAAGFADVRETLDSAKYRYSTDAYFADPSDNETRAYWRGFFGFDREENPKGLLRIYL